jgi:hypothetical protein
MGRRPQERQQEFWIASEALAAAPRHVFYDKLNGLLDEAGFDAFVEELCEPFYSAVGRDSIPPGRYFRMLFVGSFEGLDSQRGIAWRCADSLSLRRFLFLRASEESPDHSSLTRIRERLPLFVHERVFAFVLEIARKKKLLSGTQVGVEATTREAGAAMKSIVRRDSGEDWKAYLKGLAEAEGLEIHSDEDLRRFDQQRKKQGKKKVFHEEWQSPIDPDSRILKMKDGRTHLGYKAEHVVDLESEYILSADVVHGTDSDSQTLAQSVVLAQANLVRAGSEVEIKEVAATRRAMQRHIQKLKSVAWRFIVWRTRHPDAAALAFDFSVIAIGLFVHRRLHCPPVLRRRSTDSHEPRAQRSLEGATAGSAICVRRLHTCR